MKRIAVVLNPIAGAGRARRVWRRMEMTLKVLFDEVTLRVTTNTQDVQVFTRELLQHKPDTLLIIGGDGTLSHAINGMLENDQLLAPDTCLAYFNAGCGGDFARQFPKQEQGAFLNRLARREARTLDVAKMHFPREHRDKYFLNIANVGVSNLVALYGQKRPWLKKLGGFLHYFIQGFLSLMHYQAVDLRLECDGLPAIESKPLLISVCNGRFFGGRMHVAPMARVDDGLLDVVLIEDWPRWLRPFKMMSLYFGRHIYKAKVHYTEAKRVSIESNTPHVMLEADGDLVGELPVQISILPAVLPLVL